MSVVRFQQVSDIFDVHCDKCDQSWVFSIDQRSAAERFYGDHIRKVHRPHALDPRVVMALWRPGSFDDPDWDWDKEREHVGCVDNRYFIIEEIMRRTQEWLGEPAILGNDGRVWDGHHRILAAELLGIDVDVSFPWIEAEA